MRPAGPLLPIALLLGIAACGEREKAGEGTMGSTTPRYEREREDGSLLRETVTPVRVGELGPSFPACYARGTSRDRAAATAVPVRAAPFEQAEEIAAIPAASTFYICTRSHDQRWFGIVYDEAGQMAERCGVAAPINARRDYQGPCASGWVPSARIRFVSGSPQPPEPVQHSTD